MLFLGDSTITTQYWVRAGVIPSSLAEDADVFRVRRLGGSAGAFVAVVALLLLLLLLVLFDAAADEIWGAEVDGAGVVAAWMAVETDLPGVPVGPCVTLETPVAPETAVGAAVVGAPPPFTRLGAIDEEDEELGMLEMLPLEVLAPTELAPALVDVVEAVADAVRG